MGNGRYLNPGAVWDATMWCQCRSMSEANEHGATAAGAVVMPEQRKPITAWAIKAPRGILCDTIGIYEQGVIADFVSGGWEGWNDYLKKGYRCVKVHITEAQE